MRDLALTSSFLPLFIVANNNITDDNVSHWESNPGPLAWEATTLALSNAHVMSSNVLNYARISLCAIRSAIAPAHFPQALVNCFSPA